MEPYLEPLGDRNSFGFRPGKNCHQAISYLFNKLSIKKSNISNNRRISPKVKSTLRMKAKRLKSQEKYKNKKKQAIFDKIINKKMVSNKKIQKILVRNKKLYYVPYHLLNADIKSCFEKINHNWLLSNVPMPAKYEFLLEKILKTDIIKKNKIVPKKKNNCMSELQGGILSPLLMNWTLNGIENVVSETVSYIKNNENNAYCDLDKFKYYKKKDLNDLKSEYYYKKLAIVKLKYTS